MRLTRIALLAAIGALAGACEPTSAELADGGKGSIPEFLTAADFAAVSHDAAALCDSGAAAFDFANADDAFGFPFTALAGASVAFEVAGSPDLDTVLLLFGPRDAKGDYGREPVAVDDDGGDGLLSALSPYLVKDAGTFLVVVATYGGQGRGTATLQARLEGVDGCGGGTDGLVCCLAPAPDGRLFGQLAENATACAGIDGAVVEWDACGEVPPEPVCCSFVDDDRVVTFALASAAECATDGLQVEPYASCAEGPWSAEEIAAETAAE
jgi:hypothetical protein